LEVSAAAEQRILRCSDRRQLDAWVKQAVRVTRVQELFSEAKRPRRKASKKSSPS
jgi:hypothetical protein